MGTDRHVPACTRLAELEMSGPSGDSPWRLAMGAMRRLVVTAG